MTGPLVQPAAAGSAGVSAHGVARLLRRAAPVLLVAGAWMLVHSYWGIIHDSRLYMAQVLHVLRPEIFAGDLFFAFGSQDDFTLFTPIFAPFVQLLGAPAAAMLFLAVGHALWLAGAAALALRLAPDRTTAVIALLLVAVLPSSYGGFLSLSYGEPFLTPRTYAEALTLWSLWCLSRERRLPAVVTMLAASALHPLMGAVGLGVLGVYLVLADRRWLIVAVAALAGGIGLALAGIAPFDRLTQTMDADWLAIVMPRNATCFPTLWKARDWAVVGVDAALVLSAAAILSGWARRLMIAVAVAGLGGIAVTAVGGDLLHNALIIQVQLYRATWILHVTAHLAAAQLLVALWRQQANAAPITAALVVGRLMAAFLWPVLGGAIAVAAAGLAAAQIRRSFAPIPRIGRMAVLTAAGVVFAFIVAARVHVGVDWIRTYVLTGLAPLDPLRHVSPVDVALIGALALALARAAPRTAARGLLPLALILFVAGTAFWDRRDDWTRGVEGGFDATALSDRIPEAATVYWERDIRGAWLLLGRPSDAMVDHGAGVLFSRETAMAYRERAEAMEAISGREMLDYFRDRGAALEAPPALDRETLADACRAVPSLDYMVLAREVDGAYEAHWQAPVPYYDMTALRRGIVIPPARDFYLYDCAGLTVR